MLILLFSERQINLPFPAEHPYYSHTSRLAVIPKFDSPDDPITGDPSRLEIPLHPDTAANPYRVTIVSKTKGKYEHVAVTGLICVTFGKRECDVTH